MKKAIQKVIVIIIACVCAATLTFLMVGNYMQCSDKYNHGTHENCGGHWVVTSQAKGRGTFYTCDKCHTQFNSWLGAIYH